MKIFCCIFKKNNNYDQQKLFDKKIEYFDKLKKLNLNNKFNILKEKKKIFNEISNLICDYKKNKSYGSFSIDMENDFWNKYNLLYKKFIS